MANEITKETVTTRITQTQSWLDKSGEYDKNNPYHTNAKSQAAELAKLFDDGKGWKDNRTMIDYQVDSLTNLLSEIPKTQRADGSGLCSRVMGKVSTAPINVQISNKELKERAYAAEVEKVKANQYYLAYAHHEGTRLLDMDDRDKAIHLYATKEAASVVGKNTRSWTQHAKGEVTGLLVTSSEADGSDIELTVIDGVSVMTATYTATNDKKTGRSD